MSEVPLDVGSIQHLKDLNDDVNDEPTRSVSSRARSLASNCRGASVVRKRTLLGPYRRPMPRVLGGS